MGCGRTCLEGLQKQQRHALTTGGSVCFILLILYLLDFFYPPHLEGRQMLLFQNDLCMGRAILVLVSFLVVISLYLAAKEFPTVPLAITIFLCPIGILVVRHITMPLAAYKHNKGNAGEALQELDFRSRIAMLRRVTGEERNQREFYSAAMYSFILAGIGSLTAFIPWAIAKEYEFLENMQRSEETGSRDREMVFLTWATPVIVAFANFIFASFAGLRVALNEAYAATDQVKNQLIVGRKSNFQSDEVMNHRMAMLQRCFESTALENMQSPKKVMALQVAQDRMQRYLVQHISHMRQLSNIVKTVGCALIVLLGALYIAFQLTAADSHVAQMVQGFFGALFLTFVLFIYVSFHRLWATMHTWVQDLPLWNSAKNACTSTFARAFALVFGLPVVPFILALSAMNQCVRRSRGLVKARASSNMASTSTTSGYSSAPQPSMDRHKSGFSTSSDLEVPGNGYLTDRVQKYVNSVWAWDWLAVTRWMYIVCYVLILWKITPLFLNVLLAWMSATIGNLHFVVILLVTFASGMFLFMLPPVPGPPIYLFGGFVISDKCPFGFWWGAVICVSLCFVLKLTACAVQQKLIGERLGDNQWVRQTVGVHKPFIRAIEAVLRQRGLCFGKCMILCGGPDWPTSVLAGILKLSLFQCELGTCPIILNVVPLTLTGAFYLKRDESEIWMRAGNLMFTLTVLTSVMFWAGMGWAIQNEFDKNHEQLSRPREEYVELDWLDHRSEVIARRSAVHWHDLPLWVRVPFLLGSLGLVGCAHALTWRFSRFFGKFSVTDDFSQLEWYGHDGIISTPGVALCGVMVGCTAGLILCNMWSKRRRRKPAAVAAMELDLEEAAWKESRLLEARKAASKPAPRQTAIPEEWLTKALPDIAEPTTDEASESLDDTLPKPSSGEEFDADAAASALAAQPSTLAQPVACI